MVGADEVKLRHFIRRNFKKDPESTARKASSMFETSRGYRLGGDEDDASRSRSTSGLSGVQSVIDRALGLLTAGSLPSGWIGMILRFVILYFVSLLATNAREAATNSRFAVSR